MKIREHSPDRLMDLKKYIKNPISVTSPAGERSPEEMISLGKTEIERDNIYRFLHQYPAIWRCAGDQWAQRTWYSLQGYTEKDMPKLKGN